MQEPKIPAQGPEMTPGTPRNGGAGTGKGRLVPVELGQRSYDICVGQGTLASLGEQIRRLPDGEQGTARALRAFVVSDDNVADLYSQTVLGSLQKAGIDGQLLTVRPGEASKRLPVVEKLYEDLFNHDAERRDIIIALGGGVVGDLAGFVAATFKRGLPYIQVPTSLLAMVDSSVGGKTGVNHPRGKNMIGAFYQPALVYADVAVLATLPRREWGCGLAETVKHAAIRDKDFFAYLEAKSETILDLDGPALIELVARNCQIKAAVVAQDEREANLRGILNYGHTIGHAIETVLAQRDYHHGEAVALGMVAAGRLALDRGLTEPADAQRVIGLLKAFTLPTSLPGPLPVEQLYQAMRQDKKVQQGRIKFVLLRGLGACEFVTDLTEAQLKAAIESLVQQ